MSMFDRTMHPAPADEREPDIPWWARVPEKLFRLPDNLEHYETPVELPWQHSWHHLPKRTAGQGFTRKEYEAARRRAEEVARSTLGEQRWAKLDRNGYLELPSKIFPGVTYRLRVGRRIEVRTAPGIPLPWRYPYLCINPLYPLPEMEFFAHLYLYVRDYEEEVVRVAAPQPWDQALGRTF